jgi:WD40 repeat protein
MWEVSNDSPATTPHYQCDQHHPVVGRPAFSSDGRYLATAANVDVRLWDLSSRDPCAAPRLLGPHKNAVLEVALSADSRWAATANFDGMGSLWNLSGAEPKLVAELKFHDRAVQPAFSPDSRWVVFGSFDKTLKLFDLNNPNGIKPINLQVPEGRIYSVSFSPDGRWLATGGADGTIRLWDPADPSTAPVNLPGQASAFDISFPKDGRWIITGASDGTVRLWRNKLDDLINVACEIAGRDLTDEEIRVFLGGAPAQHLCGGGRPR